MAFHVGYGGSVSVVGALGVVTVCITKWGLSRRVTEKDDLCHSGSGGVSYPIPRKLSYSGTVEMPWDDAALPETLGLTEGANAALRLKLGDSSRYYAVPALIEDVSFAVDNASGAVMVTLAFTGLARPVLW